MTDFKRQPSARTQVALEYLKATERDDKGAQARLLADTYQRITVPLERADAQPRTKQMVLEDRSWGKDFREIKATLLDIMETLDGRVVMHIRWRGLRNDGQWVQREEMRVLTFTDGGGYGFDQPQVEDVTLFVDWLGMTQWASPNLAATASMKVMYNHIMGFDQAEVAQAAQAASGAGGAKCIIM